MSLFNTGSFTLHAGGQSSFKIDCDALSDEDLAALARFVAPYLQPYGEVVGIPRGGVRFADALRHYATEGPRLLVDDVLTTGTSMEEVYQPGDKGVVIFARGVAPVWCEEIFVMWS